MRAELVCIIHCAEPFFKPRVVNLCWYFIRGICCGDIILPTKTTAARNGVALSYHRVRGLYFLAVVFAATILKQNIILQRVK